MNSIHGLKNPSKKSYSRERKREGEKRMGGRGAAVWAPAKKREGEERVGERYLTPLTLELKD